VEAPDKVNAALEAFLALELQPVEVRVHRHARKTGKQVFRQDRDKAVLRVEAPRGLQLLDGTECDRFIPLARA